MNVEELIAQLARVDLYLQNVASYEELEWGGIRSIGAARGIIAKVINALHNPALAVKGVEK